MVTNSVYIKQIIPQALLVCADIPEIPLDVTDVVIANLLIDYDAALVDCRSKLQKIKELVE